MKIHFYPKKWWAAFLSALMALSIIVREPVTSRDQPHLGQDREGEILLNVSAPSIYDNTSYHMSTHTWKPGALAPTITLPPRNLSVR